jgi:hypothetical protein
MCLIKVNLIAEALPVFGHRNVASDDLPRRSTEAHDARADQTGKESEESSRRTTSSPGARRCRRSGRGRPYGEAAVAGSFAGREEDGLGGGDSSAPRPIPSTGRFLEARRSRWEARLGAGRRRTAATASWPWARVSRACTQREQGRRRARWGEDKGEGRRRGCLIPAQGRRAAARIPSGIDGRSSDRQQPAWL